MIRSTFTSTRRTANAALIALGLGAALTVFAPLVSAQTMADIKKKGEITIGVMVDVPPYATTDAQNQPDGYDADVAKLLAKDWGVKVNMVTVTGPNRVPYVLTNKVDVLVAVCVGVSVDVEVLVAVVMSLASIVAGTAFPRSQALSISVRLRCHSQMRPQRRYQ